jgi:hypothetical protein
MLGDRQRLRIVHINLDLDDDGLEELYGRGINGMWPPARAHRSSYRCRIMRCRVTFAQTSRGRPAIAPLPRAGSKRASSVQCDARPGSVSVAALGRPRSAATSVGHAG